MSFNLVLITRFLRPKTRPIQFSSVEQMTQPFYISPPVVSFFYYFYVNNPASFIQSLFLTIWMNQNGASKSPVSVVTSLDIFSSATSITVGRLACVCQVVVCDQAARNVVVGKVWAHLHQSRAFGVWGSEIFKCAPTFVRANLTIKNELFNSEKVLLYI